MMQNKIQKCIEREGEEEKNPKIQRRKKKNRVYTYIGAQNEGEIESLIATEFTVISWLWLWRLNTLEQCNTVIGEEIYSAF